MVTKEKVCRNCKRFVDGDKCPVCGTASFSRSWKGIIYINDPLDSTVAQAMGITVPGKYCLWVR